MMLPRETVLAVFPDRFRSSGGGIVGPVTLRHVVALSALGVDPEGGNDEARAALGAWIISLKPEELDGAVRGGTTGVGEWMASLGRPAETIAAAWQLLSDAAVTFIPPKKDGRVFSGPRGCGWPLEVGEFIASEYGMPFDRAMDTPLSTAMALVSVARKRNSGEGAHGGPDYYERIEMEKMTEFARRMAKAANTPGKGEGGGNG